ncbi:MAG: peptide-binding protein [Deltaproteobacteria bacterium]|nr:peptide-binding protein [Deltaproteobacteria bacterium]
MIIQGLHKGFLLGVLWAVASILPWASISRGESMPPADGDWLVSNLSAEPATLNPITATDAYASAINGHVYESLLRRDEKTLELEPLLAESWDVSEDHLTYTFHLRKDVRWHDGRPFSARDIAFSFERIRDPKVDAAHQRNYYQDIDKLEVLDDHTVRFHYKMPYFRALEVCGSIDIVPAHQFVAGEDFNSHPIGRSPTGTGPYRFLRWETGKEIVLVRNEDYWGGKPHLHRIVYKIITDRTVALQVLKQRGLDFLSLLPIQWMRQTQGKRFEESFIKVKYYQPSYSYIGWNNRRPLFADKRVRRAMTMLLDRELFVKKVLFGLGTVVSGTFYINSPEYNRAVLPYPYDPSAALSLLKSAGWEDRDGDGILDRDGRPFVFEFIISSGSKIGEQLATILQENLKQAGIRMEIHKLEWAVFLQRIDGRNFDACTMGWSLGWESDPYQLWHSSMAEKGSNFVGFRNEEADRIIEEARREFDAQMRRKLYHRFHEILHDEQPYTFLFTAEALQAVSRRFHNVNVYPMGLYPREWWVPRPLQRYTES